MTGNKKGEMNKLCDHIIEIDSSETPKIQEGPSNCRSYYLSTN